MNTTLRDLLHIIFRYRTAIAIFSLCVVVIASIYYFVGKKSYVSTASVLIRLGQEQTGMPMSDSKNNVLISRREQEIKNEMKILTSEDVVAAVATRLLGPDASQEDLREVGTFLAKKIDAKTLYDSDTIQVSFTFPDPAIAQAVLDIYLDEYIRHHIAVYKDDREAPFLQKSLADSRTAYDSALSRLTDFVGSHKLYDDKQLLMLIEQRERLRQELSAVTAEYEYSRKKEARLGQVLRTVPRVEDYSTVEVRNSQWTKLQSRLNEARIERETLSQRYTSESRLVKDINKEIGLLENLSAQEPQRVVDQRDRRASDVYASLNQSYLGLGPEISGLQAKIAALKGDIAAFDAEIDEASRNARTYEVLKKDGDLAKSTYEKYYQGYVDSTIRSSTSAHSITNVSVIEHPSLADKPERPNKKKTLIYAALLLILGNAALVLLLHLTDQTFSLPSQVGRQLGLPLAGVIPWAGPELSATQAATGLCDRMCNDFLRLFLNLGSPKVILLAKSYSGEGAATVGLNLARYMATRQHRNVAFVNFTDNPLFRQLQGKAGDAPFAHAEMGGVTVFQKNPNVPLHAGNFTLLDEIKDEFDHIFLAIPPVNQAPELAFLGRLADKVLFVIEAERTAREVVRYNVNLVRQQSGGDISLVLNKRRFHIPEPIYGVA